MTWATEGGGLRSQPELNQIARKVNKEKPQPFPTGKNLERLNESVRVSIFKYSFGFSKLMKCLNTHASFVFCHPELHSLYMEVGGGL